METKVTIKKEYHPNGELRWEIRCINDKINGIEKGYYENGELQQESPYKDDKRNGIVKEYYESGELQWETPFVDGKINGIEKGYYENGELQVETPWVDGKVNGVQKGYYESGELQWETPCKDDKINGIAKEYYENGELQVETPFVDDKANGIQKVYYESGELKEEIFDEETPQTNYYPEIKRFLEERGIEYLVHFTDMANISSIKRNGLLSRAFLQRRGMGFRFNDNVRLDDSLDYISLSITNHNKDVYQSFVKKGSIQRGAFIYIDASILYKESNDRLYCVTNAASAKCPKGRTLSDLEQMFDDVVYFKANGIEQQKVRYDKADNEPTHEQAEILYQGSIDPKYIIRIEYSSLMNDDFDDLDDIPF
ncbi:DarT ssDNA thymidine ADP-ribosyltransferase family protein [Helicobacter pullorum]|uniref:DarT ssDNA thymidine ADP-ribosyltransferase family protein n=1 Tax=Helicobacter pullorum TaxID=35818 RepID=UPI00241C5387|nr:DarT ssDNA thymidine ADP-ribosyltransferase family protein [Helicobacter pullorum]